MAKAPQDKTADSGAEKWDFIGPATIRSMANDLAQLSLRLSRVADSLEAKGREIRPLQGNFWRAIEALDFIITKEFEAKSRQKYRDSDKK